MKIACLISGRATRYEYCLLPLFLNNDQYNIDLFMSINDEYCEYYKVLKEKLSPYLKDINIEKYNLPNNFTYIYNANNDRQCCQKINNKWVPYNSLSMYYNDNKVLNMVFDYEKNNNIKYDIYMKFRPDIISDKFPIFNECNDNENILHSVIPECDFPTDHRSTFPNREIVSDAISYGNRHIMKIYCNTYTYALNKINESNGMYDVHYETTLTENIIENNIYYKRFYYNYYLDKDRRMFDINWKYDQNHICDDTRQANIINAVNYRDIKDWKL